MQTVIAAPAERRPGFQAIRVMVRAKSDAGAQQIAKLCAAWPVLETLVQPVPVTLSIKKE